MKLVFGLGSLIAVGSIAYLSLAPLPKARARLQIPTPVINSPDVPTDVSIPAGFTGDPEPFFDDYAWRAFIALMWPVKTGQRGVPDRSKGLDDPGPKVFETYKAPWEIFHLNGSPPTSSDGTADAAWNAYEDGQFNACQHTPAFGDLEIASVSKFSDVDQAGFSGGMVGPIGSQNGQYVRYLTGFNEVEFDDIFNRKLYLNSSLTGTLTQPNGSITVKSAWMDMTGVPHPERYYHRSAMVYLGPNNCVTKDVGLTGLHIVQKTATRPQRIWASFEQVDNVPPGPAGGPGTFNLYSDGSTPMPQSPPPPVSPPLPPPIAYKVTRDPNHQINTSTVTTNGLYQAALKAQNSPLQYYQLVVTQWPSVPGLPDQNVPDTQSGQRNNTVPGGVGNSQPATANVAMETFFQASVDTGCMACHDGTRLKTDFVWTIETHAYNSGGSAARLKDPEMKRLFDTVKKANGTGR